MLLYYITLICTLVTPILYGMNPVQERISQLNRIVGSCVTASCDVASVEKILHCEMAADEKISVSEKARLLRCALERRAETDTHIAGLFLQAGFDPNGSFQGRTHLVAAIASYNIPAIRMLVEAGASIAPIQGAGTADPLCHLSCEKSPEMKKEQCATVCALIQAGALVDWDILLRKAVEIDNILLAAYALGHGADVNHEYLSAMILDRIVHSRGWLALLEHYNIRKDILSKLFIRCVQKNIPATLLQPLRPYVKDINDRDSFGMTALEYAVYNNNRSTIIMLLVMGADQQVIELDKKQWNMRPFFDRIPAQETLDLLRRDATNFVHWRQQAYRNSLKELTKSYQLPGCSEWRGAYDISCLKAMELDAFTHMRVPVVLYVPSDFVTTLKFLREYASLGECQTSVLIATSTDAAEDAMKFFQQHGELRNYLADYVHASRVALKKEGLSSGYEKWTSALPAFKRLIAAYIAHIVHAPVPPAPPREEEPAPSMEKQSRCDLM